MSKVSEMTRDKWIMSTFPEWGTWLNEEIEGTEIPEGNVGMWWLGCTGIWIKTPGNTNITIDLWAGNGKRTHGDGKMKVGHQMANMAGVRKMQPNLRNIPFVIDPFAVKHVDAVLATHYHQDHMSAEFAAHVLQSGMTTTDDSGKEIPVPFIGPKKSVETWVGWGVPEDRCITVKPGDVIKFKDLEIVVLDSFDRTCITTTDSTGPDREDLWGKCPMDMDEKAVNYLIRTPGGNIKAWQGYREEVWRSRRCVCVLWLQPRRNPGQDGGYRCAAYGGGSEVQGCHSDSLGCLDEFPG